MRKISLTVIVAVVLLLGDMAWPKAASADDAVAPAEESTPAAASSVQQAVHQAVQPALEAAFDVVDSVVGAASVPTIEFPAVAAAATPAAQPASAPTPTTIGQAIIGFHPGFLPPVDAGGLLNGLPVLTRSTNGSFLTVAAPNLDVVRQALTVIPGVSYVEDNGLLHTRITPTDTRYGEQYGPSMMGFPTAWGSVGYGSSAITVALIDSGILKTHQDLTGPRILQGHDYVNNDSDPNDDCGHGTHVSGTVGATTDNGVGVAGMTQAKILHMKGLAYSSSLFGSGCSGGYAGIAQGIMDAADQGAKVISMSIGGGASSTMQNAVNYAYDKGVILVAAAGNGGSNNGIDYPGAYPNVIAVGALTSSKTRASYSDGGPQLDIAAPGSGVLSTYTGSNNATYSSLNGTSMATPHVAGALALAWGCAIPGTTRDSLISALYSTAEDLGAGGRDNLYGYGLARVDLLVAQVCNGTPPPNQNPAAAFTATSSGNLGVSVDGSASSDPDGDALTYEWNWGDGTPAGSGVTATHTYANTTTRTITLTVSDGRGGSAGASTSFTPTSAPADPDPSTPNVTSGQTISVAVSSSATEKFFKINVPAGTGQIKAVTTGPACGFFSCSLDADLYTRAGARPTDSTYACRSQARGNSETCTTANPSAGDWYIRVKRYSGAGSVNLTVTLS